MKYPEEINELNKQRKAISQEIKKVKVFEAQTVIHEVEEYNPEKFGYMVIRKSSDKASKDYNVGTVVKTDFSNPVKIKKVELTKKRKAMDVLIARAKEKAKKVYYLSQSDNQVKSLEKKIQRKETARQKIIQANIKAQVKIDADKARLTSVIKENEKKLAALNKA